MQARVDGILVQRLQHKLFHVVEVDQAAFPLGVLESFQGVRRDVEQALGVAAQVSVERRVALVCGGGGLDSGHCGGDGPERRSAGESHPDGPGAAVPLQRSALVRKQRAVIVDALETSLGQLANRRRHKINESLRGILIARGREESQQVGGVGLAHGPEFVVAKGCFRAPCR